MTARSKNARTPRSPRGRAASPAPVAPAAETVAPRVTPRRTARSFRDRYLATAVPALRAALPVANIHAVPRITKVLVAAGVGKHRGDAKFLEDVERGLSLLTGQKPAPRMARKSIAGFKVRRGLVVGLLVTLRGRRMEDFLTRLLEVALPRVRDFRGISLASVDARGNLSLGFREASVFPEADPTTVETPFGLQVTIVSTAGSRERGIRLFRALGFPFAEEQRPPGTPTAQAREARKRSTP